MREVLADIAEPESRRIEQMRAEIRQNAGALVAPGRIAHQPRRAVAVEHAAVIERAERAAAIDVAHAHEMRLEAVIVGGVADRAVLLARERSSRLIDSSSARPQRLLHQHVLAVAEQVLEHLDLRLVGNAGQHGVVAAERNVFDAPDIRPRR